MIIYTDGLAKIGEGVDAGWLWFRLHHQHNFSVHVLVHERQSIPKGELQGVLHAMLSRRPGERMVVVLDLQ